MKYGERVLKRGLTGADVEELQIRLAGFRGTVPDGQFGPGTEMQVMEFQRSYMGIRSPSGRADGNTMHAIDALARQYPLDFDALRCTCGECEGFGNGKHKGKYRSGKPRIEAYHRYEYPGIHRMLLWSVRAAFSLFPEEPFVITSGYRCSIHNKQKGRTSTNHHGKAIDFDIPLKADESKQDDMWRCDEIRGVLVERSYAQIGWSANNRKALEPSYIAPTWIHLDVRCYQPKYLKKRFFCQDPDSLDKIQKIHI